MWKCDLEWAYRQLRLHPLAYPLMGIQHGGEFFVDICPAFGCRISGGAQQRVSKAVCYILEGRGHAVLVYVDDFGAVIATWEGAQEGFECFIQTCEMLGLDMARDKSAAPATSMEWLGFQFDSITMTVTIPEKKLEEVLLETAKWANKRVASRRELQSLAGKLAHISTCIKHSRKFLARILAQLRGSPVMGRRGLGHEIRKDIAWFGDCARALNCKQIIHQVRPVFEIQCDACLVGGGGFSHDQYYSFRFPQAWSERYHISQLEALNIIVAVKSLVPATLSGAMLLIKTDNSASASVLVAGRTHDDVLAACSRELAMIVIHQQLDVDVQHVPGTSLVLADALSRWNHDEAMRGVAKDLIDKLELSHVPTADISEILDPNI